jgi:hypothetical protein
MGDLAAALVFAFGIVVGAGWGVLARYIRSKFH